MSYSLGGLTEKGRQVLREIERSKANGSAVSGESIIPQGAATDLVGRKFTMLYLDGMKEFQVIAVHLESPAHVWVQATDKSTPPCTADVKAVRTAMLGVRVK